MMKNKKILIFLISLVLGALLFTAKISLASDILGMNVVDDSIVLEASDPRSIVVKIINIALGLLAIIAVSLIIFAGFLWMTSEGNEEKVSKAKRILRDAVIGLAIILAAWGIVSFIFKSLGFYSSGQDIASQKATFFQTGLGALGACSVESVYPQDKQKNVPRNTMIMVTFKEQVASSSINSNTVSICLENNFNFNNSTCSDPVDFNVNTNDDYIFVITPQEYLGNENSFSDYVVYFSSDVLRIDGSSSIFSNCAGNYLAWGFEVSNILDLTPPKIESIFPGPDNSKDIVATTSNLAFATGSLTVNSLPNYYKPASVNLISSDLEAEISPNYSGPYSVFNVVIDSSGTKAQLKSGTNNLGVFDIVNNKVDFVNYFKLTINNNLVAGYSWNISFNLMVPADTITVGNSVYTFVNATSSTYNINVSASNLATEIKNVLMSNTAVSAASSLNVVNLSAQVGGFSGNSINLASSNSTAISVVPFSGGTDMQTSVTINDKPDKFMNSVIQINFNEAINPLSISSSTIKVINLSDGNSIVGGDLKISPNYKTVEFISDNPCGVNGCGETIYCLPANSNLRVEIMTANLFDCENDSLNCANKSPFSSCLSDICTNSDGKYYPLSDINLMDGIMDAAANSFDGNSNTYSEGPESYYYKNNPLAGSGDNFRWSFWISNKIETDPPKIEEIYPNINATSTDLFLPIKANFNKLMMSSSLRTGTAIINNTVHPLLNLISGQLVGYWIGAENVDSAPYNGEPDKTNVYINHGKFFEGASYSAQVGSGVKDIYQNCFKPSAGLGCIITDFAHFCCNGIAVEEAEDCN